MIKCSILCKEVELNCGDEGSVFLKPPLRNSTLVAKHQKAPLRARQPLEEPDVTDTPDFKLVAVDIVDVSSGLRFRKFKDVDLYLSPDDVSFEWAAEEYDAEEHKFHRPIFFEDIG